MSCGSGSLVKSGVHATEVVACSCRSWKCPACAPHRRRRVRDDIARGEPTSFLTVTWATGRNLSPEAARREMGIGWKRLVARIKRAWPAVPFEYAVVVERTQRGYPHLHVAFRGPFIPQRWISAACKALWGAPVVHIEAVRSTEGLGGYLAKYLSKDPDRIGTGKRYWFSQGYRQRDPSDRSAERPIAVWRWVPEHVVLASITYAPPRAIPLWINPDRCILFEARAP